MEFWGVEVKSGETLVVQPGDEMVLHLSQACLGEFKKEKGNLSVFLYTRNGDQKIVLGTLSAEKCPQICFDLVFEKEFVLSHNWKNGSVFFSGYKARSPPGRADFSDSDIYLEEPFPQIGTNETTYGKSETQAKEGGPSDAKTNVTKPDSAPKPKSRLVEPDDDSTEESDDDSSLRSSGSESESDDDEDMQDAVEGKDDESDEETPKKAAPSKKRPADSATKTPLPDKKAKLVTPQKTDGKKGVPHVATPYPSKQAGKTSAKNEKSKQQSPKSAGAFKCNSCDRAFNSDIGLQSHSKAKHSAAK